MTYTIRITRANGEEQVHAVRTPQTTIGSDSNADIVLAGIANLLPEHILVAPRPDKCWVSTAPGSPLWDKSGTAVEGAFVPWGSRLTLGACSFELQLEASPKEIESPRNREGQIADKGNESSEPAKGGIHSGILMLLILTIAYVVFQGVAPSLGDASGGMPAAPELFSDEPVTCQSGNPGHRAVLAEEQALAKSERSVFDLHDGVMAAMLFAESRACYQSAGLIEESEHVSTLAVSLRESLEEEYMLLRLRLSRDLASGQTKRAALHVRHLTELLRHQPENRYGLSLRRLAARLSIESQTL